MANIIVENQVCDACGTDVRSGSLFCYHCGESVEPMLEAETIREKNNVTHINFGAISSKNGSDWTESKTEEIEIEPHRVILENAAEENVSEKPVEVVEKIKIENTGLRKQPELKSAASLRRKSKVLPRKKVEIVWEEHENAPNGWFIIVALICAGLAAAVIYLAMYLR